MNLIQPTLEEKGIFESRRCARKRTCRVALHGNICIGPNHMFYNDGFEPSDRRDEGGQKMKQREGKRSDVPSYSFMLFHALSLKGVGDQLA